MGLGILALEISCGVFQRFVVNPVYFLHKLKISSESMPMFSSSTVPCPVMAVGVGPR